MITGNGELGFDTGEGAWEMATTITIGSRRENYPILINQVKRGSDMKYQCFDLNKLEQLEWEKDKSNIE